MLASKLIVVVLTLAACGASLVALRQGRLDAAHELAASRLRTAQLDEHLSRVRVEIASQVHPAHVAQMVDRAGAFEPAVDQTLGESGTPDQPTLNP